MPINIILNLPRSVLFLPFYLFHSFLTDSTMLELPTKTIQSCVLHSLGNKE